MVKPMEKFMRRVRYSVAASLDGYITDANGQVDWIIMDPDIDFAKFTEPFDTILMGRITYEAAKRQGGVKLGMQNYVFSRTLQQTNCSDATVSNNPADTLAKLKAENGKDIWLFGGGLLFHSLLELGLVDTVEVAIIPVVLGSGTPLLPEVKVPAKLRLVKHKIYRKTGTVILEYALA